MYIYTIEIVQNQQCWCNRYIYIYIYMYIYIYICAYFCTYLDLYNVSLQGNRIQTYSICTLLHLLIKEASQKSQPIHFLLSSCAIYTEKYCAYIYIYTQYIHLYIYHWETTEPAMLASHYMLCTEYTSIRYIEVNIYVCIYIYIYTYLCTVYI